MIAFTMYGGRSNSQCFAPAREQCTYSCPCARPVMKAIKNAVTVTVMDVNVWHPGHVKEFIFAQGCDRVLLVTVLVVRAVRYTVAPALWMWRFVRPSHPDC